METQQQPLVWESKPEPESMETLTLGRVMTTLLTARPKQLLHSISRLSPHPQTTSLGSLEESLWFLHKYVRDAAAEREELFDEILVPILQHSLRSKETKHGDQAMILLNWLFKDELLFQVLASNLANIMLRKDDRYVTLGWCTLVRSLLEYESVTDQQSVDGIREKYNSLLKTLCPCIPHLSYIVCQGSTMQDGFEFPSRLSVSAADCFLSLTEALIKKPKVSSEKKKTSSLKAVDQPITSIASATREKNVKPVQESSELSSLEREFLLWNHLRDLITLVQRLLAWSRKGRPLHAKGLERVLKWLQEIKRHYGSIQDEAGSKFLKNGALLLSSCWKHYSVLLHLEDHKFSKHCNELLDQYLSGIQCFTDHHSEGHMECKDGGLETRKFFLNCMCLLLGRFDRKKFESVVSEYGTQMSHVLLSQVIGVASQHLVKYRLSELYIATKKFRPWLTSVRDELSSSNVSACPSHVQSLDIIKFLNVLDKMFLRMDMTITELLHCDDEDVIDGVVCMLKAVLLKPNFSSGSCLTDTRQMDSVILSLLHLLDERDSAAKAIVMLIAEYCSIIADGHCLQEVLKRLSSKNVIQRRNAVDVLSEIIRMSSHSVNAQSHLAWQDIASHLLECLGDEETVIREQTSNLLPMINPSLVLPALVRLIYSSDEKVQSSASGACIGVLKHHSQKFEVICMLLDCLSNLNQSLDSPETIKEGSKLDSDRVLKLIPQWSKSVQDWHSLVGPLIDKMFAEPSNAIIVRFLSYISEHLMEAADIVVYRVLLQMRGQKEIESFSKWECGTSEESTKMQRCLFERLCPLLIIRLLPLRVFDELSCSIIYGQLSEVTAHGYGDFNIIDHDCVAALLLNRAFSKSEFEEVRKLAAELCGRIHPQVLFPVIGSQLNHAVGSQDIMKIKACLFSICTSIVVRGQVSILSPAMLEIRKMLEAVLLWPSLDEDEVYKAQHGCIDCLALMMCAELQSPGLSKDLTSVKSNVIRKSGDHGDAVMRNSVLTYVVHHIIHDEEEIISNSKLGCENCAVEALMPLSFRLCMVNVLISACQKISDSGKKRFARKVLPHLIQSAAVHVNPEIRVGCIQVLFSAVYHLKSAVLPYSSDLLKLSIKFLREGSEKERMAAAKLMASLMASEDSILASISEDLLEARYVLSSITSTDPSLDLQRVCEKLLACLTSS